MNAIANYFAAIYDRFFSATTAAALADLEKAEARLRKAIAYHDAKSQEHDYIVEQALKAREAHDYAAVRAERVATKLADLIG